MTWLNYGLQAHNYEMEGMELRITHALEATNLMYKIPGLEFFELAEKLYPDDIDLVKDDVFAKHFNEVSLSTLPLLVSCVMSCCVLGLHDNAFFVTNIADVALA